MYVSNLTQDPLTAPPAAPTTLPVTTPPAEPANTLAGNAGGSTSLVAPATPPAQSPAPPAPPLSPPQSPSGSLTPPATAPVAIADLYALAGQGSYSVPATGGVLLNDLNGSGQPMFAVLVSPATVGSVLLNADGSFQYTIPAGFAGTAFFSYDVTAGGFTSNIATVTLTVAPPVTVPPVGTPPTGTPPIGTPPPIVPPIGDPPPISTPSFTWAQSVPIPPTVGNPGDQASVEGQTVSLSIQASGPSAPLRFAALDLPTGLAIDNTGLISGTVDASASQNFGGSYATQIIVSGNDGGSATTAFTWTVTAAPDAGTPDPTPSNQAPALDPIPAQTSAVGSPIELSVNATSGNTLNYTVSGLPGGLVMDPASGDITGTLPDSAYSPTPYQVTVTVSDGTLTASQSFAWQVTAVSLATPDDQTAAISDTVSLAVTARDLSGGTLTYTATELPPGLAIDATTGLITGTITAGPTWQDDYQPTVTATNGTDTDTQTFDWTITPSVGATAPTLANPGSQTNTAGDTVSFVMSGTSAISGSLLFSADGLPDGSDIDPATGIISGSPTGYAVGTTSVTVTATDPVGAATSVTFPWIINPAPVTIAVKLCAGTGRKRLGHRYGGDFHHDGPRTPRRTTTRRRSIGAMVRARDDGTVDGSNGSFTITDNHTYGTSGSYPLSITITRPDGGTVTANGTATATNATILALMGFQEGMVTAPVSEQIAEFTYGNPLASANGFSVQIDPGDGSGSRARRGDGSGQRSVRYRPGARLRPCGDGHGQYHHHRPARRDDDHHGYAPGRRPLCRLAGNPERGLVHRQRPAGTGIELRSDHRLGRRLRDQRGNGEGATGVS